MFTTKNIGDSGEEIAANYLIGKGYEIIERNFRTNVGEIDIIAAHDGFIVFVEVKTINRYVSTLSKYIPKTSG